MGLVKSSIKPHLLALSDRVPSLVLRARRGRTFAVMIECSARKKNARRAMEVTLEPRSALTVVFVWRGRQSVHITQKFRVGRGARLHLLNLTLGSCTHDVLSEVKGSGGESHINWIVHGQDTMECRLSARNVFKSRDGQGGLSMRGVAEGKTRIACNGSIEIGSKAAGTKTHLTERILLLDPTARADAVPSLDVKTHDVQASHSASVSRIHPEDLFYFASRGVAGKKARKILIEGFLGTLMQDFPAPIMWLQGLLIRE